MIYCRVSTKEQVEEGSSLTIQENYCKEYAIKHGFEVAEIFIEKGESAKTANRTELQKLLKYCAIRKNGISAVIAYKIDRISRSIDDYSQIRILLKRYGVEIKSTSEHLENTPAGRFMENTIANVAQFDNEVRAERSTDGMKEAVKEGRYIWQAPLGYDNVKVGDKSTIAPNQYASLIRESFELVATATLPTDEVRRKMALKGLRNRKGGPLSVASFCYLLNNVIYTGWLTQFGERNKGLFEPIVSRRIICPSTEGSEK